MASPNALAEVLGWSESGGVPSGGEVVVVSDALGADGGFVVALTVAETIKRSAGNRVVVVAAGETVTHHAALLRKLAPSPVGPVPTYIDVLAMAPAGLGQESADDDADVSAAVKAAVATAMDEAGAWIEDLASRESDEPDGESSGRRSQPLCLVVVDDLDALDLVCGTEVAADLCADLGAMAAGSGSRLAVMFRAHGDVVGGDHGDSAYVDPVGGSGASFAAGSKAEAAGIDLGAILHLATLDLRVQPLQTGFSRDVDGRLVVIRRSEGATVPQPRTVHFKVLDGGVRLYGSSSSSSLGAGGSSSLI